MTRYTIRIDYSTGDSFNTYDTSEELGISWENLDRAKDALSRIEALDKIDSSWKLQQDRDTLAKAMAAAPGKPTGGTIGFLLDDGTEHRHSTFWRGYFEVLREAEVVIAASQTGMKYTRELFDVP